MGSVYKIEHVSSGKCYVGSSINYKKRWHLHKSDLKHNRHHSFLLQRAWSKHGSTAFIFAVIEDDIENVDLQTREQYWIDQLKPAYNTSQTVNRHALGKKLRPLSEETKAKIRAKVTGFKHTDEARRAMSSAKKGKKVNITLEERNRRSKQLGAIAKRPLTEERKRAISEKQRGRKQSDSQKQKRSQSLKGKPWSEARRSAEKTRKKNKSAGQPWSEARRKSFLDKSRYITARSI